MQIWLHSIWFHLFIVVLVLLDAFTVLFELFLDVGAFGETRDLMQPRCPPVLEQHNAI